MHMDSSSTTWLPVLAGHHHHLLHDFTTPPPAPSAHHHLLLRSAPAARSRVANKRRSRPSRRLPTTYISADPASFRRMVHQVTGASDDFPPQPNNAASFLITRPAPVRAAAGGSTTGHGGALVNINTLLPTLDTSAGTLSWTGTDAPASSAVTAPAPKMMEAGGACNTGTGGAVFPTLESWDHHAPLF